MRDEGNKNYRFVPFRPGAEQKKPKKKAKKLKKIPLWVLFNAKYVGEG